MEFIREVIDSNVLDQMLTLPRSFRDHKVEILVFPVQEHEMKINMQGKKINELMEGSVTQSLIGAIPHPDITSDEIRSLRLQKYDRTH
ncbi:MAG: hypothetical protein LBB89_01430 [Treponema sp.]|jgi:hypothetical protein|nr:hypothetical protein [Treponema sp.]